MQNTLRWEDAEEEPLPVPNKRSVPENLRKSPPTQMKRN
jgi:hypothetical protein